jgi:fumarate hydratase class II
MHVAAVTEIEKNLIPALTRLQAALASKSVEFDSIIKIGRTHLQVILVFIIYGKRMQHRLLWVKNSLGTLRR